MLPAPRVAPPRPSWTRCAQWFDQAPAPTVANCAKKVLVARFDDMDTRFAIVAWGRALLIDEFDLDTALTFAQQWMEHDSDAREERLLADGLDQLQSDMRTTTDCHCP